MSECVLIFGAGPYARLLRRFAQSVGRQVSGFVVDAKHRREETCDGLPVHAWGDRAVADPGQFAWLVGVGYRSMPSRAAIARRIEANGASLDTLVAPSAVVADTAQIGPGCVLFPAVVVEEMCGLGRNNVLWSGSIVAHDTVIGNDNYLSPGVTLSGNCRVGSRCFFGTRASAIDGIEIADDCLIAAGAMLTRSAVVSARYQGSPARAFAPIDPKTGVRILR